MKGLRKTNFDAIAASAPVDKAAALQASKGEQFQPSASINDCMAERPALRPVPPDMPDFTGKAFGRLVVIGLAQHLGSGPSKARWACRCSCGSYVYRKTQTLRAETCSDRCGWCAYTLRLRDGTLKGMRNDPGPGLPADARVRLAK